jgi:putative chitinase
MIQESEFRAFAPNAKPDYVQAISSADGASVLGHFGLLANVRRLSGFLGTAGHETGGFTIVREAMRYSTVARLKAVWPTRFVFEKKYRKEIAAHGAAALEPYRVPHEAYVAALCNNERALAEAVYGGRMENPPGRAFDFRGCGWIQNTGYDGIVKIATACGIDVEAQPELLDSASVTLRMACYEWAHCGANEMMDANDFIGASALVNVGNASAKSRASVVGVEDRLKWFRRASLQWGNDPDVLDLPAALAGVETHADGDTPPGQDEHWLELEEATA